MRKINVIDSTLRYLCSTENTKLLFREKLSIASLVDSNGADCIELPAVQNIKEDKIINKTISEHMENVVVSIIVGNSADGVKEAYETIENAKKKRLVVSLPLSTVQMEYMSHLKAPKMLALIESLVSEAKKYTEEVEFEALDATRSDKAFLFSALDTAIKSGATSLTIRDEEGKMMADEAAALIKELKEKISVPLNISLNDELSLAVSSSLSFIKNGGDGVKVALGCKDVLSLDSFGRALREKEKDLDLTSSLKYTSLHSSLSSALKSIHPEHKEERLKSDDGILIDNESTPRDVEDAILKLGYDLSEEDKGKVYDDTRRLLQKKSSISNRELEAIIASTAMQVKQVFTLLSYVATLSNKVNCVSSITLLKGEETLSGVATGDGPIDAAFRAIENCIGHHYELDDFQIQAVTEGKEALGAALVRLRSNGKLYSGNGLSTDICGASIRAYINALNKIVSEDK